MLRSISYKSKQFLWLVSKLAIVIGCCYFIYDKIAHNKNIKFDNFWYFLVNFDVFSTKNILLLLFFTLFNWILEITKWQFLAKKVHPISWSIAGIQTLASSTLAMVTPVRTGEYGVKILYYPKEERKEIALAAFIGNIYQLVISLGLGVWGIVYLFKYFDTGFISTIFLIFLTGILAILILFFFKHRFHFFGTWLSKFFIGFNFRSEPQNRKAFLLSLIRYLIFSHQFYFLITLFEIDMSYIEAMACITSMYGLTSVVPILPVFDFLLKGSVSILVFSFFNVNPIMIITITTLMWILNFAIPALIGSFFMLKLKPALE
ncbi:lysylphosphatidylglycerol synthase domain-containing protein [Flavobacteriaceae bacterium S356]|uniref:Lysylphosphatidylglycerol synthase domain-containing protein n=1 Tax=Asprobacillus argus TaxID=3076534 RepID=A0ABU3LGS1_9FLAO|nr:lysylphosphatidylglycerol synthase domain-containing protein [Flavobacteriaceae bacterium S356]